MRQTRRLQSLLSWFSDLYGRPPHHFFLFLLWISQHSALTYYPSFYIFSPWVSSIHSLCGFNYLLKYRWFPNEVPGSEFPMYFRLTCPNFWAYNPTQMFLGTPFTWMLFRQFKLNSSQIGMITATPTPHCLPVSAPKYVISANGTHTVTLIRKGHSQFCLWLHSQFSQHCRTVMTGWSHDRWKAVSRGWRVSLMAKNM